MSGFFALLDDIAALAKLTMSTLDDTASMAVKTSAKVSAAAVDDIAATPQYVTGITPDREIPIIKRITLGSVRNQLLVILPAALVLNWLAPALLPVALLIGGTYLCFEAGEKILSGLVHTEHVQPAHDPADEDSMVRAAITTDFVLSAEIMLLALAELQNESSTRRIVILILIALLITLVVYGLVGALIKLDDLGVRLAERSGPRAARALGRTIVRCAPAVFTVIGAIGTVAMLWVGGHILAVNLDKIGVGAPHRVVHWAEGLSHHPVLTWLAGTGASCVIGIIVGCAIAGFVHLLTSLRIRRTRGS